MHEVLVNRLGGLSLPRKSVVRLTDRPDMTLDVHRGRKTTKQQQQPSNHMQQIATGQFEPLKLWLITLVKGKGGNNISKSFIILTPLENISRTRC